MNNWFLIVLIIIVSNKVSEVLMKSKLKKKGYIYKSSFFSSVTSLVLILTPKLNLYYYFILLYVTIRSLVDDKFLFKITKNSIHSAENVKRVYESTQIEKDVLKEAMTLDGADEKTIDDEMEKVDLLSRGITKEDDLIGRFCNTLEYSEEEYNWACAQYNAEKLLEELELNALLDDSQKAQLLELFKESYLEEIKGSETDIAEKILNIIK